MSDYELGKLALSHQRELRQEAAAEGLADSIEGLRRLANHDAEKHRFHLCALVENRQMATVESLIGDGHYICANCGRVAAAAANLCNPVERQR